MKRLPLRAALAALLTLLGGAGHAADPLPPGEYLTEGGWGRLAIRTGRDGKPLFFLNVLAANAHTCEMKGPLQNGRARLKAFEVGKPCEVRFQRAGEDIKVTALPACRYYCGVRAWVEGTYLRPAPACTTRARRATRDEFQRLYTRKEYDAALAQLAPLLETCEKVMGWGETGWVRNDLALTQFKLGDAAACRQTLAPLAADAARDDATVLADYAPADADTYLPILRATRTNLALCAEKPKP